MLILQGNIYWKIPEYLKTETQYSVQEIWKSSSENKNYTLVDTIPLLDVSGNYIETYYDQTFDPHITWYLVTLADPIPGGQESSFIQAVLDLTPRESRLVEQLRSYMPPIINKYTSNVVFRQALMIGLAKFNSVQPVSSFDLNNYPYEWEALLIYASQIAVVIGQYLPISIRDFSYSGVTPSITIDRASKLQQQVALLDSYFEKVIMPLKFDLLMSPGVVQSLGTFNLPLSLGSRLAPGLLNIFDLLRVGA